MNYSLFKVGSKPFCVWEVNLKEKNLEFINAIDHKYFEYQAYAHQKNLESDYKQNAALALRTSFHHGLETLFSLICASLQAPDCVHGWMLNYSLPDLRSLLRELNQGRGVSFFHKHILDHKLTWNSFSERVYKYSDIDLERTKETANLFAKAWQKLCNTFLDEKTIAEYNSIKHGYRAQSGGFSISFGEQEKTGVPAPPEKMVNLGGSDFGSSFFVAEKIQGETKIKNDPNFKTKRHSLNWDAESMAHSLNLISISINNLKSYLQIINGSKPEEVRFIQPLNSEYFDKPWGKTIGVTSASIDFVITDSHIKKFTKEKIEELLGKALNS